jgi:hypothetical protein
VGMCEFHDTLVTIIIHFGGNVGDRHHPSEISLICCPPVLLLRLLISPYSYVLVKALSL